MKVLKFGGTSVGSIENIKNVKSIINDGEQKVVVLSAMSGTTNTLVTIAKDIENKEPNKALDTINKLHSHYINVIDGLLTNQSLNEDTKDYVTSVFNFLAECASKNFSKILENAILAQGELLSTYMFNCYLQQENVSSALLPALDFMRIDKYKDPDLAYIKKEIATVIKNTPESKIYITQGFIC